MQLRDIEKHASEMGITLPQAIAARRRYLWEEMTYYLNTHCDPTSWDVVCIPAIHDIMMELVKLKTDLYFRRNPPKTNEITPEMVERAKAYPISNLIQFDGRGKARCFNHEEKTGSLHHNTKRNKAHCFGSCNQSFDPIDVLMLRDGDSFREAVKKLSNSY